MRLVILRKSLLCHNWRFARKVLHHYGTSTVVDLLFWLLRSLLFITWGGSRLLMVWTFEPWLLINCFGVLLIDILMLVLSSWANPIYGFVLIVYIKIIFRSTLRIHSRIHVNLILKDFVLIIFSTSWTLSPLFNLFLFFLEGDRFRFLTTASFV